MGEAWKALKIQNWLYVLIKQSNMTRERRKN
jgi:hypothetical protein